jgi:hypothetical protein
MISSNRQGARIFNYGWEPIAATGPAATRLNQSNLINQEIGRAAGGAV